MYKLRNIKQPTNAKNADIVIYTDKMLRYTRLTQKELAYTVTFVSGVVIAPYSAFYGPDYKISPQRIYNNRIFVDDGGETTFKGLPLSLGIRNPRSCICGAYKCINVESFTYE